MPSEQCDYLGQRIVATRKAGLKVGITRMMLPRMGATFLTRRRMFHFLQAHPRRAHKEQPRNTFWCDFLPRKADNAFHGSVVVCAARCTARSSCTQMEDDD